MDTTHGHHCPLSLHKAEVNAALFGEERRDARPRQESQSRAADFVPQLIRLKYVVLQGSGHHGSVDRGQQSDAGNLHGVAPCRGGATRQPGIVGGNNHTRCCKLLCDNILAYSRTQGLFLVQGVGSRAARPAANCDEEVSYCVVRTVPGDDGQRVRHI
jgi:hypothetical protein